MDEIGRVVTLRGVLSAIALARGKDTNLACNAQGMGEQKEFLRR